MNKFLKVLAASIAALAMTLGLAGCAAEPTDLSKVTAIVDVRTPAEFSAGHLQGAVNVDIEAADFNERIVQLDKSGKYLIYCHSGRRAGIALEDMKTLGFIDVTNIGGLDEAAKTTALPVIQ